MSDQKLQDLIDNGYEFTARAYIMEAWTIFKKQAGGFIGFLLLFLAVTIIVSRMPYIGLPANYLVVSPVGTVGFYIMANLIQRNQNAAFSDFFKGFEHLGQLALMSLVLYGVYILLFSPSLIALYRTGVLDWYQTFMVDPVGAMDDLPSLSRKNILVLILNFLPLLYVQVAYMWAPHFIVFYQKGFWDGLETSRRLVTRQWFSVFKLFLAWIGIFMLFGLVMMILATLGSAASPVLGAGLIFGLVIAMFLIFPVVFISYYTSFAAVTGLLREEEGQADILDHLVD